MVNAYRSLRFRNAFLPEVAINAAEDIAVVVWYRDNSTDIIVQAPIWKDSSWSTPENLSDAGQDDERPQVALNLAGDLAAVLWTRSDGANDRTQASIWNGTSWSASEKISEAGLNAERPQAALNSSGDVALAVWQSLHGADYSIKASTWKDSSWSVTANTISAVGNLAARPQVSLNSAGDVGIAVWNRRDNSGYFIVQASNWNGTTWSSPDDISYEKKHPKTYQLVFKRFPTRKVAKLVIPEIKVPHKRS